MSDEKQSKLSAAISNLTEKSGLSRIGSASTHTDNVAEPNDIDPLEHDSTLGDSIIDLDKEEKSALHSGMDTLEQDNSKDTYTTFELTFIQRIGVLCVLGIAFFFYKHAPNVTNNHSDSVPSVVSASNESPAEQPLQIQENENSELDSFELEFNQEIDENSLLSEVEADSERMSSDSSDFEVDVEPEKATEQDEFILGEIQSDKIKDHLDDTISNKGASFSKDFQEEQQKDVYVEVEDGLGIEDLALADDGFDQFDIDSTLDQSSALDHQPQSKNESPLLNQSMNDQKLEQISRSIRELREVLEKEESKPTRSFIDAPKLVVLNIASAAPGCDECIAHALVKFDGAEREIGTGEVLLGYKVDIVGDRLNLIAEEHEIIFSYWVRNDV